MTKVSWTVFNLGFIPMFFRTIGFFFAVLSFSSGLYYKIFTIVIYGRNAIGQYYEITIVDYDRSWGMP